MLTVFVRQRACLAFVLLVLPAAETGHHPNPTQLKKPDSALFSHSSPARTRRGARACPPSVRSGLARPVCSVRGRRAGCSERGCRGGVPAVLGARDIAAMWPQRGAGARSERASACKDTSKPVRIRGRACSPGRRPVGTVGSTDRALAAAVPARLRSRSNCGRGLAIHLNRWRGKLRCSAAARRRYCSATIARKAGAFAQKRQKPGSRQSNRAARESLRDYELRSADACEHISKEA